MQAGTGRIEYLANLSIDTKCSPLNRRDAKGVGCLKSAWKHKAQADVRVGRTSAQRFSSYLIYAAALANRVFQSISETVGNESKRIDDVALAYPVSSNQNGHRRQLDVATFNTLVLTKFQP